LLGTPFATYASMKIATRLIVVAITAVLVTPAIAWAGIFPTRPVVAGKFKLPRVMIRREVDALPTNPARRSTLWR
jgi:hypothetical protein